MLKKEWIVEPCTLIAANAVGATTAQFLIFPVRKRINVDFPSSCSPSDEYRRALSTDRLEDELILGKNLDGVQSLQVNAGGSLDVAQQ